MENTLIDRKDVKWVNIEAPARRLRGNTVRAKKIVLQCKVWWYLPTSVWIALGSWPLFFLNRLSWNRKFHAIYVCATSLLEADCGWRFTAMQLRSNFARMNHTLSLTNTWLENNKWDGTQSWKSDVGYLTMSTNKDMDEGSRELWV